MPGVYSRVAKITNAAGRSGYLGDEKRQEEIVLQKSEMRYSWQQHADFERTHQKTDVANHEALEVHIALPNQLSQNPEKLERVCDDLVEQIVGKNHDYEYAVHWNHSRTNLHVHILFS
ncbi:relaxase/mobilization nuclease domain-containing protein, partial [Faecalibaculum rodentium]